MSENNNFQNEMQDKIRNLMPDYSLPPQPEDFRVGFGRRTGAYLIDMLIYLFILVLAMKIFGLLDEFANVFSSMGDFSSNPEEMQEYMKELNMRLYPLVLVIVFAYYSMEIFFGQTLGKMLLGIKIANADRTLASLKTLSIRFFAKYFNYFLLLLYVMSKIELFSVLQNIFGIVIFIGCFLVLSASRMALHDRIARTAVYYKDEIITQNYNEESSINV
jgi:uncharacterized RDD family membrane protein YckC